MSALVFPAVLATLDRVALEALIEAAIAEADARDGDADMEPDVDVCEAADDHLLPITPRWPGHRLTRPDDDFGLCLDYGTDQRRPVRVAFRY